MPKATVRATARTMPKAAAHTVEIEPELSDLIATWQQASRSLEETHDAKCAAQDRAKQAELEAAHANALWQKAIEDYHAIGARVAKLKAKTMTGVMAKLLAAAEHCTADGFEDDAHAAILVGAALDALALTIAQNAETRS